MCAHLIAIASTKRDPAIRGDDEESEAFKIAICMPHETAVKCARHRLFVANRAHPANLRTVMNSVAIKRVLLFAAPAILLIVACVQRYVASASNLTSWHGAGFGMFATLPPFETRKMSTILVTPDGKEIWVPSYQVEARIPLGGWMPQIHREILAWPSESRIGALARELAESDWVAVPQVVDGQPKLVPQRKQDYTGDPRSVAPFPLSSVRIEIWEYDLDSPGKQLVRNKLISVAETSEGVAHGTGR
jgi:hypothetical protein